MNSTTNAFTRYLVLLMLGATALAGSFALATAHARADSSNAAPVISNIATSASSTGATVTWSTDQAGSTQVLYGPTTSYNASTTLDNASTTSHTSFLGGLTPNTLYHFEVATGNASGTMATSSDMTFTTAGTASSTASSTAPVVSLVLATPAQTGATISWSTDVGSNSQVMYGLTTAYGNATPLDTNSVTSHLVTLSGLQPSTLYHFLVTSSASSTGTIGSSTDMTFTTLAASTAGGTGTTTDTGTLQNEILDLQTRVSALEAEIAAILEGGGTGGTGTTTPPSGGILDQSNITVGTGGTLNFGGHNFPHEENITITLNGMQVGTAHADGGGNFSTGSMTAPSTPGTYTYVFTGASGDVTSATVTVH